MPTPTTGEARKALATLALYFSKTPALQCDVELMNELPRPFVDVVTDWAVGFGYERPVQSASVMGLVHRPSASQFDGPFEGRYER